MIDEDDFPEDESITKWTHGTESLLPQERNPQQQRTLFKLQLLSWTAQLLLFIFSVLLLHQAMSLRGADSINCVQKHSMFCKSYLGRILLAMHALTSSRTAPATGAVHDDYEIWRFNGTFRFVSPYKGPPSVSVDTSWKEITERA